MRVFSIILNFMMWICCEGKSDRRQCKILFHQSGNNYKQKICQFEIFPDTVCLNFLIKILDAFVLQVTQYFWAQLLYMSLSIPIKPLVLVGSSGSGRSAIMYHLTSTLPHKFMRVISHTTRPPRPNEKNGMSFHFTSDEWIEDHEKQFLTLLRSPNSHYYGLSFSQIHRVYKLNKIPIFKMTLDAYRKNVGISRATVRKEDPFPERKSTLHLLRDKNIECNALYINVTSFEELERRLKCSPFSAEEQRSKMESAKKEHEIATKYFGNDDIINSIDIDETLIHMKSRLFQLY